MASPRRLAVVPARRRNSRFRPWGSGRALSSRRQTTRTRPEDGPHAPAVVYHQRGDLERRIARPGQWVATAGLAGVSIQAEVALRHAGKRRLLADPKVTAMVVEHRDQLVRRNVDLIQAARAADGWLLVAGR
jgi:hypothetical protein